MAWSLGANESLWHQTLGDKITAGADAGEVCGAAPQKRRVCFLLCGKGMTSLAGNQFIEIDAPHLCVLEGESDELCNDGIYGKALAKYLQSHLCSIGYGVPGIACEDWGWYVPAVIDEFQIGICVYGFPRRNDKTANAIYVQHGGPPNDVRSEPAGIPLSLCVTVGTQPRKYWDWRRFRRTDRSAAIAKLNQDLVSIFDSDGHITVVRCTDEFPLNDQS